MPAQLDALAMHRAVHQRLVEFVLDNLFVRDAKLAQICREIWSGPQEEGGLVSKLWVEGAFPSEVSDVTLASLAVQGKFNRELAEHLHRRGAFDKERRLYRHQLAALEASVKSRKGVARPAVVVTAGTGGGKTESFLLPILHELFEKPKTGDGVRCIILYPMNALVNDQVERLHQWLQGQPGTPRVTLFHFTSETPEDHRQANADNVPSWKDACRFRTRQAARGLETHNGNAINLQSTLRGPQPDILITNYSMLEYMLCRPQDAVFFGSALRAVVLDEAHLYTGALAAEITLLLRRVLERCGLRSEQVAHFAASATLGAGNEQELQQFATTLFSKPSELIEVIQGRPQRVALPAVLPPSTPQPVAEEVGRRPWLTSATLEYDSDSKLRLAKNAEACASLAADLPLMVAKAAVEAAVATCADQPAKLLHAALQHAPLIHQLEEILWNMCCLRLDDLAVQLWPEAKPEAAREATKKLLQLVAAARSGPQSYPLVPQRLHFLARATEGLVVCLDASCKGNATHRLASLGCVSAGFHDSCPSCEGAVLSLYRCSRCGGWLLAGEPGGGPASLKPVTNPWDNSRTQFFHTSDGSSARTITIDPRTGHMGAVNGVKLVAVQRCPHCEDDSGLADLMKPFVASAPLTLSILAESALAQLPEFPDVNNPWLPARGRRLLAFSDSRQEAARLGPRLRYQHEIQVVRAALANCLEDNPVVDASVLQRLERDIETLQGELAQHGISAALHAELETELRGKKRRLLENRQGGPIHRWTDALAAQHAVQELLDYDTAGTHLADRWRAQPQQHWESNIAEIRNQLPALLARELARPFRPQISLETVGLVEVCYPGLDTLTPPDELLGVLPHATLRQAIRRQWSDFLAALCDTLRLDGCITLGSEDLDASYQFGRHLVGRWCTEQATLSGYVLSFAGATDRHRRRRFATEWLRRCGFTEADAKQHAETLLRYAFSQLRAAAGQSLAWLAQQGQVQTDQGPRPAIQLRFPSLTLRPPPALFRSEKTGSIWPRSLNGLAPEAGCDDLQPVSKDDLDKDPRYGRQRREFRSAEVFRIGLWAEEHSAQLLAKENRRLQDLFKLGIRNLLSSTTTLELGIDIGGLNCVLMSNVPPGKANYLQRAGRAGRRADGSSVVVTYARPAPYDREVFQRFDQYLARSLRRPRVLLDRERIVERHVRALLLGEFFRAVYPPNAHVGAMSAFSKMGLFCGVEIPARWDSPARPPLQRPPTNWPLAALNPWWHPLEPRPGLAPQLSHFLDWLAAQQNHELKDGLARLLVETGLLPKLSLWQDFLAAVKGRFLDASAEWENDYQGVLTHWQSLNDPRAANAVRYDLKAMFETTVIEAFAERQVLPRYGFPIGLLRLKVKDEEFRLERAGLLALREYVPGSQLIAGGKLVTSRGLLKHWTGATPDNYFGLSGALGVCANQHGFYAIPSSGSATICPICGAPPGQAMRTLLLPHHGFCSAAWDRPKQSADVERVGSVERLTITFAGRTASKEWADYAGITGCYLRHQEDGELLVFNSGDNNRGFAICTKCGYTDSESTLGTGAVGLPGGFDRHAPIHDIRINVRCWAKSETPQPVLRNRVLAARQTTDVLLVDISTPLGALSADPALITTLGHALQIAGARLLELDSREIGVLTTAVEQPGGCLGIVLYDNTPGGAGHVRELAELDSVWLEASLQTLFVNGEHHARCDTACLDCILTFDTQTAAANLTLTRRRAHDVLRALLKTAQ